MSNKEFKAKTGLNIFGNIKIADSAGSAGQHLVSGGAGANPSWLTSAWENVLITTTSFQNTSITNGSVHLRPAQFYTWNIGAATTYTPDQYPLGSLTGFDAYQAGDMNSLYKVGYTVMGTGGSGSRGAQMAFNWNYEETAPSNLAYRVNDDTGTLNSWGAWTTIWDSANFQPSNYVAKAGDTMSGSLKINSGNPGTNSAKITIYDVGSIGDGETHLGYWDGSQYLNYLRGNGTQIERKIDVIGLSTATNQAQIYLERNGTTSVAAGGGASIQFSNPTAGTHGLIQSDSNAFRFFGYSTGNWAEKMTISPGGDIYAAQSFMPAAGCGIRWPSNAFGGGGDDASILLETSGGEATKMRFRMSNDADDGYEFYTHNAQAGDSSVNLRFQIHGTGGVTVGTYGALGTGTTLSIHNPTGVAYFRNSNAAAGVVWQVGAESNNNFRIYRQDDQGVYLAYGATSWSGNSDERLKDIIEPITNGLEKVSSLRSVIGRYKTDETATRRSFVIAQDVQAVLPEAVSQNGDYLGVAYSDLVPLLISALKDVKAELDNQKSINQQIIARLSALESK